MAMNYRQEQNGSPRFRERILCMCGGTGTRGQMCTTWGVLHTDTDWPGAQREEGAKDHPRPPGWMPSEAVEPPAETDHPKE